MSEIPPSPEGEGREEAVVVQLEPHRGVLILVLGIIALVVGCIPLGFGVAIMASGDLKEMDAGQRDPNGRGLTQAGKILGVVSIILSLLLLLGWFLGFFVLHG
jgi:hypothetical protein